MQSSSTVEQRGNEIEVKVYYPAQGNEKISPEIQSGADAERNPFSYKRATDVIFSLFVIFLIFPILLPVLFLLIRMSSKGPVIFKQKRVGYLGRPFWCYKLRTMYINDSSDTRQASSNDPRVTGIGKFLRNSSLDELPQFINVLLGHMSIVGPRPHMFKDFRDFSEVVPNYRFRSQAKPGITGLSQIRGYRGPATTFHSIFRRYQWDAYYVRNRSFRLDMKIMGETALLMLRSLINRNKPVQVDPPIYEKSDLRENRVKRIA
ncbi:sugar transferase [Flavitalea flava]